MKQRDYGTTRAPQVHIPSNVIIKVQDARTGRTLQTIRRKNLVVLNGRNLIRDFLADGTALQVNTVKLGTGSTPPKSTDADLQNTVLTDVLTQAVKADGKITFKYYLPSGSGNGNTISEAGLYAGSTLFARVVFAGVAKTSSITLTVTWDIAIAATAGVSSVGNQVSYTTASLVNNATENGLVGLGVSGTVFQIKSNGKVCRVRGYTSAAARTADASRPYTTPPTDPHGVCFDVRLESANGYVVNLSPVAPFANLESTPSPQLPVAITNEHGSSTAITVTWTLEN